MHALIKLVKRNPAIAIGAAAFAGLALGAGWVSLPSLSGLLPAPAAPKPTASAAPPPPPDPLDAL